MKTVKRIIGVWVCLSISMYGLPAFAVADASASKTELSDAVMAAAVGGSMHAEMLDTGQRDGDTVTALVAVGATCCTFNYELEAIDLNGNLLRTLASGTVNGGQAKVISGTRLASDPYYVVYRVKLTHLGVPGVAAVDTFTRIFSGL